MKKVPVYGIEEFGISHHEHSLYANYLRIHLEDHQFVNTHHRHSTYVCVLFTNGTGQHIIDFNTYDVIPGSMFLLTPGQAHCWSLSDDVEGYVFFHTKEMYENEFLKTKLEDFPFYTLGQNYPAIYLEHAQVKKIAPMFELIVQEFHTNYLQRNLKIASLISMIYIDLSRLYRDSEKQVTHIHYTHLKRFQQLIEIHFKHKKLPREYADLMHMTTRHLSRICAEMLDTTPTDLILERILIEAKRMLIHSDASISYVAEELGYEDYSYFIRLFKKKVCISPKEFQKRLKVSIFE